MLSLNNICSHTKVAKEFYKFVPMIQICNGVKELKEEVGKEVGVRSKTLVQKNSLHFQIHYESANNLAKRHFMPSKLKIISKLTSQFLKITIYFIDYYIDINFCSKYYFWVR